MVRTVLLDSNRKSIERKSFTQLNNSLEFLVFVRREKNKNILRRISSVFVFFV